MSKLIYMKSFIENKKKIGKKYFSRLKKKLINKYLKNYIK